MPDFADLRERMVRQQIEERGIIDPLILDAFRSVPRELFISSDYATSAYEDHPLPIEANQTISQPYIVALMIEAAAIRPGDIVLEIGSGSGYAAAIMSRIAHRVVAIERHHVLVEISRERLHRLGFRNISIIEGDGSKGLPGAAPFNAIIAAASGHHVPQCLIDQLHPFGRLVMPIGASEAAQELVRITKTADGMVTREVLGGVRFVPLIGEKGWRED